VCQLSYWHADYFCRGRPAPLPSGAVVCRRHSADYRFGHGSSNGCEPSISQQLNRITLEVRRRSGAELLPRILAPRCLSKAADAAKNRHLTMKLALVCAPRSMGTLIKSLARAESLA